MLDGAAGALPPADRAALARLLTPGGSRRTGSAILARSSEGRASRAASSRVTGAAASARARWWASSSEQIRRQRPDGRRAGLRSAKPADRRRVAGRPLPHAARARRRRRLHSQPGRGRRPRRRGRALELLIRLAGGVRLRRGAGRDGRRGPGRHGRARAWRTSGAAVAAGEPATTCSGRRRGVLEVADVVVIHKADLPGAEQTAADLRGMLR